MVLAPAPGTTVAGPSSCGANSSCGNVTVTSGIAAGTYSGSVSATPSPTGTAGTAAVNMTVAPAGSPTLSLTGCTSNNNTTTPTPATTTCSVVNTSTTTAATSISYTTPANTTAVGPTGACAANTTCGNVTVTTATGAASYTGNLIATPFAGSTAGTAATTSINLTVKSVASSAALTLINCTSNNFTTSPNKASTTCSVKNTGTVAITAIAYSAITGMTRTGPTGACAINATCGTLVVSTGTTAKNYTGTLTITTTPVNPVPITLAINLTVNAAGAETVTYLHTDGLGSPVAKTNASGVRISQTKYEAYGMTVAGSDQPTIGFTGHYNDKDTALTYMQQRYYDPVAGRFLSKDPVLTNANTGEGFNRYAYASNNPYKYIDPNGKWPTWVHKRITYNAAISAGYSETKARALAQGVRDVDIGTQGTSKDQTVLHAMAGKDSNNNYQTKEAALKDVVRLIGDKNTSLEKVLHALQDKSSPEHGGKEWHNPLEFADKDLVTIVKDVVGAVLHVFGELFISEQMEAELTEKSKEIIEQRQREVIEEHRKE